MLNNQKGVTLLELLISITLLAILLIPMSNLFLLSFQTTGATTVQLSDRAIAVDILEEVKEAVRGNKTQFTYSGHVFQLSTCSSIGCNFTIDGKSYFVKFTIDNDFKTKLANQGITVASGNQLVKVDLKLEPTYKPQDSDDIEYTVVIARRGL